MEVTPLIDIINSEAAQFIRGDSNEKIVYGSPEKLVQRYVEQGATSIALVNVTQSAERKAGIDPFAQIAKIIGANKGIKFYVGGGVRTLDDVDNLIKIGADKVIISTVIISDKEMTNKILAKYNDRIIISISAKYIGFDYFVFGEGRSHIKDITVKSILEQYPQHKLFLIADVGKDGSMSSPNYDLYKRIKTNFADAKIIASGGISNVEDFVKLHKESQVHGAFCAKAFNDRTIELSNVLDALKKEE